MIFRPSFNLVDFDLLKVVSRSIEASNQAKPGAKMIVLGRLTKVRHDRQCVFFVCGVNFFSRHTGAIASVSRLSEGKLQ